MLIAGVLLLVAVGLLGAGLTEGSPGLQWASVAASAAAAVVLVVRWSRLRAAQVDEPVAAKQVATESVVTEPADEPVVQLTTRPPVSPAQVAPPEDDDPPVEEVEVTDLLLVLDLTDEVLVLDERPGYHVAGCRLLAFGDPIALPLVEARTDGFTACGLCRPDHTLAMRERARRAERRATAEGRP